MIANQHCYPDSCGHAYRLAIAMKSDFLSMQSPKVEHFEQDGNGSMAMKHTDSISLLFCT